MHRQVLARANRLLLVACVTVSALLNRHYCNALTPSTYHRYHHYQLWAATATKKFVPYLGFYPRGPYHTMTHRLQMASTSGTTTTGGDSNDNSSSTSNKAEQLDLSAEDTEESLLQEQGVQHQFGPFHIPTSHIFYSSVNSLTVAFVNLRPIVPGHVLVTPSRCTARLSDLTSDEYSDLWASVRVVQNLVEEVYGANASNVAVQDGCGAGQSVAHVHVHILPRVSGDLEYEDEVYDRLEVWAPKGDREGNRVLEVDSDDKRVSRSVADMAKEAMVLKDNLESSCQQSVS